MPYIRRLKSNSIRHHSWLPYKLITKTQTQMTVTVLIMPMQEQMHSPAMDELTRKHPYLLITRANEFISFYSNLMQYPTMIMDIQQIYSFDIRAVEWKPIAKRTWIAHKLYGKIIYGGCFKRTTFFFLKTRSKFLPTHPKPPLVRLEQLNLGSLPSPGGRLPI